MGGLGHPGRAMPKVRPGDHERALALISALNGDKETREYLKELVGAQAAHDKARDTAQAAESAAAKRESEAQAAEAAAVRARQALADETDKARTELGRRETAVTERERVITETEASQTARAEDLARREAHLREAGVAGF